MLDVPVTPILTERLELVPVAPAHTYALWPVLSDPALYQWIPRQPPSAPADVEARLRRIAQRTAPGRDDQWINWTVLRRDSGEAIGVVESTVPPSSVVLIAYLFASTIWRQGYATEAMRSAIAALEQAGAAGFEATIDTRNEASRALAAKLGFQLAETRASDDIIAGAPSMEEVWRRDRG
jgi:[ribosomal protein S5]-alanine N-acetyltransferase